MVSVRALPVSMLVCGLAGERSEVFQLDLQGDPLLHHLLEFLVQLAVHPTQHRVPFTVSPQSQLNISLVTTSLPGKKHKIHITVQLYI